MPNDGYEITSGKLSIINIITSSDGYEIGRITIPANTDIRLNIVCLIQNINDITDGYSYFIDIFANRGDNYPAIIDGYTRFIDNTTTYNSVGNETEMLVNVSIDNNDVIFTTNQSGTNTYNISLYPYVYYTDTINIITYYVSFNGIDGYVSMGNVLSFERTDEFSTSFWVNSSFENQDMFYFSKTHIEDLTDYYGYSVGSILADNLYTIRLNLYGLDAERLIVSTKNALVKDVWYHCVITYNGSSSASGVNIYINGYSVDLTIVDDTLNSSIISTGDFTLMSGDSGNVRITKGNLDEVAIWSKELSATEVLEIYNNGVFSNNLNSTSCSSYLISWWKMGDGDTYPILLDNTQKYQFPIITDLSSNSYNGTAINMSGANIQLNTPGSKALVFDGTNEYIRMGNVLNFEYNNSFSFSCWVKTTTTADYILSKRAGLPYKGYSFYISASGTAQFILTNDSVTSELSIVSSIVINNNVWNHVVITYDGNSLAAGVKFYVNLVLDTSPSISQDDLGTNSILNTTNFNIGGRTDGTSVLAGSLSDVAVWNKELSLSEITEIYNNKVPINLTTISCAANLAAWWRCGERYSLAAGGVPDFSGNGLHGTQINMEITDVETRISRIGSSMVFNGIDEYVTMGNVFNFERTDAFSVSCWFKFTTTGWKSLISKQLGSPSYAGWSLTQDGTGAVAGSLRFQLTNYTVSNHLTVRNTVAMSDGKWHHIIITYNGSSLPSGIIFYIDGVAVPMVTINNTLSGSVQTAAPFSIGSINNTFDFWNGFLDEISIWNKVLSVSEVQNIYNTGIPTDLTNSSNLIGYWRMGDNTGVYNGTMINMLASDIKIREATPYINMLIYSLTYDENPSYGILPIIRSGSCPLVSIAGAEFDGFENKYITNNLPIWYDSSSISLYSIFKVNSDLTRGIISHIGEKTVGSNPVISFNFVNDPVYSSIGNIALKYYDGSVNTSYLGRRNWKFSSQFPVLTKDGYIAKPQAFTFIDGYTALISAHYEETESIVYKIQISDMSVLGSFSFGLSTHRHISSFSWSQSNELWCTDYETSHTLQIDLDASLLSGTAVITADWDTSVLTGLGCIEFITVSSTDYVLLGQYASSGTPYLYVIPTTKMVDGYVFNVADRYKRFQYGYRVQGFTLGLDLSTLYISRSQLQGSANIYGHIETYNINSEIISTADNGTLTSLSSFFTPSKFPEDVDINENDGYIWTMTEGLTLTGDEVGFSSIWFSDFSSEMESTYEAFYDGNSISVYINNNIFWEYTTAITASADILSMGGLYTSTYGFVNSFTNCTIRSCAIKNSIFTETERSRLKLGTYYETNTLNEYVFTIINPGAESGTTGWTNEVGALGIRTTSPLPPYSGSAYFSGGTSAQTISSQRLDVISQTGISGTRIDVGDIWCRLTWKQSNFDGLNDPGGMGLRFLDVSQAQLSITYSEIVTSPGLQWRNRNFGLLLPTGTRYIDIIQRMDRTSGTNNDTYIDAIECKLFVP